MKILVIDDEPLIHISIERLVQKCEPQVTVLHAYNGKEMLEMLKNHDFLLAYVDIKMPGLSGLEAIKAAKEISPSTRYYIMTGFDEFEYAKQAIKLKVDDYLMKPLDLHTIKETIQNSILLDASRKRARKTIFRNWLESTLNHREGFLESYSAYYCLLILITIDRPDFPRKSLLELLGPFSDNYVSSFTEDDFLLLCFSEHADTLQQIRKELSAEQFRDGITIFISPITQGDSSLPVLLQQLLKYSALRVPLGIEKCYTLNPLLSCNPELLDFSTSCILWQKSFRRKDYSEFINRSEFICGQLEDQALWKPYRSHIYSFLAGTLGIPSLPDHSEQLRSSFYIHARSLLQTSGDDRIIHSIIQYIREHFCESISITSLSEQFGLSANYISNLLKQELGMRYNDYITQLRITRAKELLLSTSQSVKEITAACGYYSQSHFTRIFTEHENCTPTEYRKKSG